jgi:hypothetical protein
MSPLGKSGLSEKVKIEKRKRAGLKKIKKV